MKRLILILLGASLTFAGGKKIPQCTTDSIGADYKTSYGGLGVGYSDMEKINARMQQKGFDRMDQGVVLITGGEQYHFGQFIFAGESTLYLWRITDNDTRRNIQGGVDVTAIAGYDLIANEKSALFPFVGFGIGSVIHHMSYEGLPFDEIAASTEKSDETIWQPTLLIKTGVGFDVAVPGKKEGTTVGLRAGYTFDVSDEDRWYRDLSTVSGAPSFRISGPFVKLVFGIKSKE